MQFTETERKAICSLILKLLSIDKRMASRELSARAALYDEFGITFDEEHRLLELTEAVDVFKSMDAGRRSMVLDALRRYATTDGELAMEEKNFIQSLAEISNCANLIL